MATLIPLAVLAQAPAAPGQGSVSAPAGSVLAAQADAKAKAAEESPPTEADLAVDAAAKQVAALESVSADFVQKVDMLDQKFEVNGRYLKATGNRMLLRLKVTGLPDADGIMQQVCDGQTLWDFQQILDNQSYQRLEVAQVFERLKSPELDDTLRKQILAQLGFAGPDELLRGLRRSVRFEQKESAVYDEKDVWILRGVWKNRDGLMGPGSQPLPLTAPLPPYVPSLVILVVDKATGWPQKLTLVGRVPSILLDTRKIGPDGRPIGSRSSIDSVRPTRVELIYSNVELNPTIKPEEFAFQAPANARVQDNTPQLVQALDQQIQLRAAQRKAEAAKTEVPLLDQPISIPAATPK